MWFHLLTLSAAHGAEKIKGNPHKSTENVESGWVGGGEDPAALPSGH